MSTYFAILTQVGEAKLANAIALGQTLKLKKMGVGDGNGALPIPDRLQKALVHEVRRADLNQLAIDPANASQIIVEQVLPEDVGGWWIREIGIYDEAGDLCAVANCPPSYKPLMAEGSGRTQVVRIVLIVASTAAIELKIDPSVILATRKYIDDQVITVRAYSDEQLDLHLAALDPHPQYSMKTVATLPKFDTSKKLANAEFVHANGVKHCASFGFSTGATLTADHVGGFVYTFGTGGFTLNLPAIAGLPTGASITYSNQGGIASVPVTCAVQGTNTIQVNGGIAANVKVAAGDSLTFVVIGANEWAAIGTGTLSASASFGASTGTSGYQKLPSGLILQWGSFISPVTPGADAPVNFHIGFTTLHVVLVGASTAGTSPVSAWWKSQSPTGFVGASTSQGTTTPWLAIGR
ncbi:phage tail protein [Janthinobacterium sp. HSC-3S05]|uniref:phage tail protein n=1 Tax=Janthinobacterium lividum TaxID=29581 RepID=UPI001CD8C9A7|nr:phage tail protein [Janthinobacterium lividum]MCA1862912.1 phage tail protein [Janthinobacterium lividum]